MIPFMTGSDIRTGGAVLLGLWLGASGSGVAWAADGAAGSDAAVASHATDHFVVLHRQDEAWAAALGSRLEDYLGRFLAVSRAAGFVPRAPAGPMTWVCLGAPDDLDAYHLHMEGDAAGPYRSYYSSRSGRVVILQDDARHGTACADEATELPDAPRVAHEVAHQLAYNTGLQARGVLYPFWLSEGLATVYEAALARGGAFGDDNPARRERLVAARRSGRVKPLRAFILETCAPDDAGARSDAYAQSWGLVDFLHGERPTAFHRYVGTLARLDGGLRPAAALEQEFVRSFGAPELLEPAWQAYLAGLETRTGEAGASLDEAPALAYALPLASAVAPTPVPALAGTDAERQD